jgi:hypothetical protein
MNVEIGTEAAQFPEKEYINGIFLAVCLPIMWCRGLFCRAEMKHKLNPVLDAQLNRNRKVRGHRRNFSDGRITSSLTDNMVNDVSSLYPPS